MQFNFFNRVELQICKYMIIHNNLGGDFSRFQWFVEPAEWTYGDEIDVFHAIFSGASFQVLTVSSCNSYSFLIIFHRINVHAKEGSVYNKSLGDCGVISWIVRRFHDW
jgi:hypothetical protein